MTDGETLYNLKNPAYIEVYRKEDYFRQNILHVPNPDEPTPWRFLTQKSKDSWENYAKGHSLIRNGEG